jgi:hypothetical protein
MVTMHLDWHGPFNLATHEGRRDFMPPNEGGVYLWCVGRHPRLSISYVGEASNLGQRLYEHVFSTLGGAYCLYSDDHLFDGATPVAGYNPGLNNILELFLGDFAKYSAMAHHNLLAYSFFWATVPGDRCDRQTIESALINAFRESREPIQNARTSIAPANCRRLMITSRFKPGFELTAVPQTLEYGTVE